MTLEDRIASALKNALDIHTTAESIETGTLTVYSICTAPTADTTLFQPAIKDDHCMTRKDRLVFVGYSPHAAQESFQLMFAFCVSEYSTKTALIVNMEKIDTTGITPINIPVASTSIKAYINHILLTTPVSTSIRIHVFARSQSQYLFPGSKHIPSKRIRTDTQLVQWWMRVLADSASLGRCDNQTKLLWVVPGETSTSTTTTRILSSSNTLWTWGLGADSHNRLPLFPDDPVTKACGMVQSSAGDIDPTAVMDILGVLGECQSVCALLCLESIPQNTSNQTCDTSIKVNNATQDELNALMKLWMTMDFSNVDACTRSSTKLIKYVQSTLGNVGLAHVDVTVAGKSDSKLNVSVASNSTNTVQSIQGLVKRHAPAEAITTPIKTLSANLIKRQKQ
ncbi:hypothetical protein BATDEDRAFT_86304 [Batrachochytrium dendrobatidis JAM81]|uniref:histone acetyltransferase n=1 Tax=Batrachochytrium dendrobatidis (strain JAM81 / FGSC 10211) TaxID=684364 RepID=F4NWK3_BATDJ|nr:uncharacterized protein BATDEDRAFT_86304 [Batrachochytrium dendrobatidis JAM81]EGF82496.1 hypothetical protein BATDEDRAFT_86304 [Batrachochytrium dendrobatidis JAM81]|eukprot:XP_006676945.1 hypothetical protein BATDEDRAFT_86304 [Batrachochytrium dendrobatidis JAM81]